MSSLQSSQTVTQQSQHRSHSTDMENVSEADLQEIAYQKVQSMKDAYFSELWELHQSLATVIQKHEGVILSESEYGILRKRKQVKAVADNCLAFLWSEKGSINLKMLPHMVKYVYWLVKLSRAKKAQTSQDREMPRQCAIAGNDSQTSAASDQIKQLKQQQQPQMLYQGEDMQQLPQRHSTVQAQPDQHQRVRHKECWQNFRKRQALATRPLPESVSGHLSQDTATNNASGVASTTPVTSASPISVEANSQNADQTSGAVDESNLSLRPVDQLAKAVLSSSPMSLCSSIRNIVSESETTAASNSKRRKVEVDLPLLDEIRDINGRMIDTVISISNDKDTASAPWEKGTIIIFSYEAVSLGPSLRSLLARSQLSLVTPMKVFVPSDYPTSYPILLDNTKDDQSKGIADIFVELRPMSIKEMAEQWDACARKVVIDYASQCGGGTFSSRFGHWQNAVSA